MLLAIAVLLAIPVGYFFDGALRNYLYAPLKLALLPCAAFAFEAYLGPLSRIIPVPVNYWLGCAVFIEYAMLAVFLWENRKSRGISLLGIGMLCNFAAIFDNGFRMPVSPIIHRFPGAAAMAQQIADGNVIGYTLVNWDSRLWFLGDTIPVLSGLASVGDILMAVALVIIIAAKMTTRPPKKKRRPAANTSRRPYAKKNIHRR